MHYPCSNVARITHSIHNMDTNPLYYFFFNCFYVCPSVCLAVGNVIRLSLFVFRSPDNSALSPLPSCTLPYFPFPQISFSSPSRFILRCLVSLKVSVSLTDLLTPSHRKDVHCIKVYAIRVPLELKLLESVINTSLIVHIIPSLVVLE